MSLSIRLFGNRNRAQELVVEAKRRMALLKQFMGFQNLKQLEPQSIRMSDGSTIRIRSFFGIDIVEIVGVRAVPVSEEVEGDLIKSYAIFLWGYSIVTGEEEPEYVYTIWKVKQDGQLLTPISIPLENYCTFFAPTNIIINNTVKSNQNEIEHYISFANQYPPHWWGTLYYGKIDIDNTYGIRNDFQPLNWDYRKKHVWDSVTYDGGYYVSARHPWIISAISGNLIKNLEMWLIDESTMRPEWDVEPENIDDDGHRVGPNQVYTVIFAILNELGKFVGMEESTSTETYTLMERPGPAFFNIYFVVLGGTFCHKESIFISSNETIYKYRETRELSNFVFGDIVIESLYIINTYKDPGIDEWDIRDFEQIGGVLCDVVCSMKRLYMYRRDKLSSVGNILLVDYDYDNSKIDDEVNSTFIMIYSKEIVSKDIQRDIVWTFTPDTPCATTNVISKYTSTNFDQTEERVWMLSYKIEGGSVEKIELCKMTRQTSQTETPIGTWVDTAFACVDCDVPIPVINTSTTDSGWSGQRIVNCSVKATSKYLLYSYVLQNALTGASWNDTNNSFWEFEKHVLGIISLSSGLRTEHEVNDILLGDLYRYSFDKELASAVGLHVLSS